MKIASVCAAGLILLLAATSVGAASPSSFEAEATRTAPPIHPPFYSDTDGNAESAPTTENQDGKGRILWGKPWSAAGKAWNWEFGTCNGSCLSRFNRQKNWLRGKLGH